MAENNTPHGDTTEAEDQTEAPAQESKTEVDWKAEARKWESRAKENLSKARENESAAQRLAEIEQENQTEAQKVASELDAAKKENADLTVRLAKVERDALAQSVAAEKGVPAKYLAGDDEDAMRAYADEFLKDLEGLMPQKSWHIPDQGTGDPSASVDETTQARERAKNYKL